LEKLEFQADSEVYTKSIVNPIANNVKKTDICLEGEVLSFFNLFY